MACAAAGRTCTISRSTRPYKPSDFFADQRSARPVDRRHDRAGASERGRAAPYRASRRAAGDDVSVCGRRRGDAARPRALRHLLFAVPRPDGRRRRHGRAARISPAAVIPCRSAAAGAARTVFDVITNGFGAMPDYAAQIPVRDRWAIAAYMRALQLSQNATVARAVARRAGAL